MTTIPLFLNGALADVPLPPGWAVARARDQREADANVPPLLATGAKVIVLADGLREAVDLTCLGAERWDVLSGWKARANNGRGWANTSLVAGVVCRGNDADPTHPDWVRGLRDQCTKAETPFSFLGWGLWLLGRDEADLDTVDRGRGRLALCLRDGDDNWGIYARRVGPAASGRTLDGRTHDDVPDGLLPPPTAG